MRIVTPVFTGMTLAVAGIMTFGTADTALAQTQKQDQTSTAHSQPVPSDQRFGTDRQLQGRFYKRQKTHEQKTQKTPDTEKQVNASAHEAVSG
jgi:hypothetical protein